MSKARIATIWLDGCAGCHMSVLDIDEILLALAGRIDLVYGPLVDAQQFPADVDVTLVEGAISSQEDLHRIRTVRANSRVVVALGDCAVTGNVPAMRNTIPAAKLLHRVYVDGARTNSAVPADGVPALLPQARPLHEYVKVDIHVPGCPPAARSIAGVLSDLLDGKKTKAAAAALRFG